MEERHGSPYDRGTADAYYHRPKRPHYYKGATYSSERIEEKDMTEQQLSDYDFGYEMTIDRKDFGEVYERCSEDMCDLQGPDRCTEDARGSSVLG